MKLVDFEKVENKRAITARKAYEEFHNGALLRKPAAGNDTGEHPLRRVWVGLSGQQLL